jgi:hypothetical protein
MGTEIEEKIRRRAYEIWESEGRVGDPQDHWLRAERELRGSNDPHASVSPEAQAKLIREHVRNMMIRLRTFNASHRAAAEPSASQD